MKCARCCIAMFSLAVVLAACSGTTNLQTGTYRYLYDYESRELHPEYLLYHDSDDSSQIWFRVHSSELLYSRANSSSPFQAKIGLKASLMDKHGVVKDTLAIRIVDAMRDQSGWLTGNFRLAIPQGEWSLLVTMSDLSKGSEQSAYLRVDKTSPLTSQNYLLVNYESDEPIFTGFVSPGQTVEVYSARNAEVRSAQLFRINGEVKLPPPPFSPNQPELPTLQGAVVQNANLIEPGHWSFVIPGGNYFFTHDEMLKSGLSIKTSGAFYPEVRQVSSLEWPIRYITTKTEHEDIQKNNYPKKQIDQFWIECAGSKDHARELIRIYYSRVEEANLYFASFTEGWRTDRGMIHLLFGNPAKVTRWENTEIWQYGEEGTPGMLQFVFRKVDSPFSNNVYLLDRDPNFRPYWEKMVQTWRSGRVYAE